MKKVIFSLSIYISKGMFPLPPTTGISSDSVPVFHSITLIPLNGGRVPVSLWEGGGTQQGCCAAWEVNWLPPPHVRTIADRHTSQNMYFKAQINRTNEDALHHRHPSVLGNFCMMEKVTGSITHSISSLIYTSLAFTASMETHTGSFSCFSFHHWDKYACN